MIALLLMLWQAPPPDVSAERIVISNATATTGTVTVVRPNAADEIAMLGTWTTAAGRLTFTPRFPFEPGTEYRVVLADSTFTFSLPKPADAPGTLVQIFPTAKALPANALRFYLHFDRPMKQGQGHAHFELLDAKGVAVANPFLPIDEELWSDDDKRLTLYFDPGRVKQELTPRREQGPILVTGNEYTLVVRKAMRTATGQPLTADVRKSFTVVAPYETALDPAKWPITIAKNSVEVTFDRILDHALALRCLTIQNANGDAIPGTPTTDRDDTVWRFAPKQPCPAGRYRLVIHGVLEDICGNRIGTPFDAPLGEIGARHQKPPTKIEFSIP